MNSTLSACRCVGSPNRRSFGATGSTARSTTAHYADSRSSGKNCEEGEEEEEEGEEKMEVKWREEAEKKTDREREER